MSFIKDALSTIGKLTGISSVKDAAETIIGAIKKDPDLEKAMAEIELQRENSIRDLYKAEVQQDDKFVKRARPSLLWLVSAVIACNFVLIPIINAVIIAFNGNPISITYPDLPEEIYWLIGSIFGLYTGARSFEKVRKNGNGKK